MTRILILAGMLIAGIAGELRAATVCRWVPSSSCRVEPRRERPSPQDR